MYHLFYETDECEMIHRKFDSIEEVKSYLQDNQNIIDWDEITLVEGKEIPVARATVVKIGGKS